MDTLRPLRALRLLRALGSRGAAQNAMAALQADAIAMAEVDSAVDRVHRHAAAHEPAA